MRLQGKCAIITGAGRGIGKAIAQKFLQEGAEVVICDVHADRIEQAVEQLMDDGKVRGLTVDITQGTEVQRLVNFALEHMGSIDILVNNAGIASFESFFDITEESWNRTLAVNLTGTFLCSQAVARVMKEQQRGAIVNMASTNGLLGEAGLAHYNASKAGVVLLSKTLAIELAPYGIRVNSVCPGMVSTELQKEGGQAEEETAAITSKIALNRFANVEEVANAFAFLASDEASFITGTELVVDGGQTCQQ